MAGALHVIQLEQGGVHYLHIKESEHDEAVVEKHTCCVSPVAAAMLPMALDVLEEFDPEAAEVERAVVHSNNDEVVSEGDIHKYEVKRASRRDWLVSPRATVGHCVHRYGRPGWMRYGTLCSWRESEECRSA